MNKIIIPAAMLAVGVALVGSVSSTLAWYQYSTKAQAAFIGTSVGQSENLEIKTADNKWSTNLKASDVNALAGIDNNHPKKIIPITPAFTDANADGILAANAALPADGFYAGIETGFDRYADRMGEANNYVQFTLNIRYRKDDSTTSYEAKNLKLVDLTITDNAGASNAQLDLYKAVRVHFAVGSGNTGTYNLFARDNDNYNNANVETDTFGNLDTDNDNALDTAMKYDFESGSDALVMYGIKDSVQTAKNAAYKNDNGNFNHLIGVLPADNENGLAVTVTIWIEGWQKLEGFPDNNYDNRGTDPTSAMWKPETYINKTFNVGMRFQAEDIA